MSEADWFLERRPICLLEFAMRTREASGEWISARRARLLALAFLEATPLLSENALARELLAIRLDDPGDWRTHHLGARGRIQKSIRKHLSCPHDSPLPCLRCLLLECLKTTPDLPKVMGWFHGGVPMSADSADLTRCLIPHPSFVDRAGGWTVDPALVPDEAKDMAEAIFRSNRQWDDLPILADLLELRVPEIALPNLQLMRHLRYGRGHARGCWAIDALLGRLGGILDL